MFLETILPLWLDQHTSDQPSMVYLASMLETNHDDLWFKDFLRAPPSVTANQLLASAMNNNRMGETSRAEGEAAKAEAIYLRTGNLPGAARSHSEIIYALRRKSLSHECGAQINQLRRQITGRHYFWLEIVTDYESANCRAMVRAFDVASAFAQKAVTEARQHSYPSLILRSLTLLTAFDSEEGRYRSAFNGDAEGLRTFWQGVYPPERGFQFYSDAAIAAEQKRYWHLAATLHNEAAQMLAGTERYDFRALAHYHAAASLMRAADYANAQVQTDQARALIQKMSKGSSKTFIEANSTIQLVNIDLANNRLQSAENRLLEIEPALKETDNFIVKLAYLRQWADLKRRQHDFSAERNFLDQAATIANQGFANLTSVEQRAAWSHEVDQIYRRRIEIELLANPESTAQPFFEWQLYRNLQISPPQSDLRRFEPQTLIRLIPSNAIFASFVILPTKVGIWTVQKGQIRFSYVNVNPKILQAEVLEFVQLCSDKNSSIQKVKSSGSRLYQQLIKPIVGEPSPVRSLIIEPDGFLGAIPWAALTQPDGNFLGQAFMINNTLSVSFTSRHKPAPDILARTLVISSDATEYEGRAYPTLPDAADEAQFVAGISHNSIQLFGDRVTRDEILKLLTKVTSFHFAGHAVSRDDGGELLLGRDQALSASNIRRLNLGNLQIAVLAACSTAADSDPAQNPNALVSSFLIAGTRTVVATHWDVDSAVSSSLVKIFYRGIHNGLSIEEAVRVARETVRHKSETAHPFYWGAFDVFSSTN